MDIKASSPISPHPLHYRGRHPVTFVRPWMVRPVEQQLNYSCENSSHFLLVNSLLTGQLRN
uniref:Uncharacterized protein n=1 Tax=Picea glauca TaxID=3330 RepID=A0A101M5F6_PICGL|nr:hypothetical protein ABT39_MTgene1053 [Picea glauca]